MATAVNLYSTDESQINLICAGCKLPAVRYVVVQPQRIQQPITGLVQDIARFPCLGFSRCAIQIEPSYDGTMTQVATLYYEITKYRDGGSPIMLSAGSLSPPYDKLDDEFQIACKAIGLKLGTADAATTGVLRPILASWTLVFYP